MKPFSTRRYDYFPANGWTCSWLPLESLESRVLLNAAPVLQPPTAGQPLPDHYVLNPTDKMSLTVPLDVTDADNDPVTITAFSLHILIQPEPHGGAEHHLRRAEFC